jgi:peptidoglycan/LPS O-acetylase OafA/YrhL
MRFTDYLKVRTARLYPTIFIGAVVSLVVAFFLGNFSDQNLPQLFAMQAFLVPAMASGPLIFPLNSAYWSLFYEVLANVVHAAFVKHLTTRRLAYIVIAGAIALIWSAFHYGRLNVGALPDTLPGGFARVTYSFAIGLLLYNWRAEGVLRGPRVHVAVPVGILVIGMWAPVPNWPYATIAHDLFATLILSPLIVILAMDARVPSRLAPAMSWLALISYPLYALHLPMVSAFADALTPESVPKVVKAAGWMAVMALCVFAAWVVAVFYEPRARRWLGRILPRRHQPLAKA